jgi:uncharacterized C2H2 Zn-finger protein
MPKLTQGPPEALRPYLFHGVELSWRDDRGGEAAGDCPLCGKEGKFYVAVADGRWQCKVCMAGTRRGGGEKFIFLRLLWEESRRATTATDLAALARERRLLSGDTPDAWGACKSLLTGEWLLPGYSADGRLTQLYAYLSDPRRPGRRHLLPTPGMGDAAGVPKHGLFAPTERTKDPGVVYYCEGPWDGMALWEVLGRTRGEDGGLVVTGNPDASLLAGAAVVAVPGCNVFYPSWARVAAGRRAVLLYDNDHPRPHPRTGQLTPSAGYEGVRRAAGVLAGAEGGPETVHWLAWGPEGYNPNLPSGYDVRDWLAGARGGDPGPALRVQLLGDLLTRAQPIPADWVPGRGAAAVVSGGTEVDCLPCPDWRTLTTAWKKALKWTLGLDRALSVMLASCLSTDRVGDQLWVKVIGPAACGKSTLCEALSVNKRYVLAKSTIRGFHSGFQSDRAGSEDSSLLVLVKDKTLVTKDGDTLLQAPNLGQILSEARDVYDRVSRTHYRNKMSRDYEGVSMTWLLCGTNSLRALDSSELGERFLDCVIVEDIDEGLEDEIGWRVANRADRELLHRADGKMETRDGPELVEAKRLTGGYVGHLRGNGGRLLESVSNPEWALRKCTHLAKFVAFLRARPSARQAEKAEREMSFRLISQLVRLARCLAVVLNRPAVDDAVMAQVRQVALDTARGRGLEVARHLHARGPAGVPAAALAAVTCETREHEGRLLRFWAKIGVVESFRASVAGQLGERERWRLTPRLERLYREVVDDDERGGGAGV